MVLQFHERVMTPNGKGLVQGRLVSDDPEEDGLVMVSHKREDLPERLSGQVRGIWWLDYYRADEVEAIG